MAGASCASIVGASDPTPYITFDNNGSSCTTVCSGSGETCVGRVSASIPFSAQSYSNIGVPVYAQSLIYPASTCGDGSYEFLLIMIRRKYHFKTCIVVVTDQPLTLSEKLQTRAFILQTMLVACLSRSKQSMQEPSSGVVAIAAQHMLTVNRLTSQTRHHVDWLSCTNKKQLTASMTIDARNMRCL